MKTIYRIARTELLTLFYSPVAWFVLLAFAFQAGMDFSDTFARCLKSQDLGYGLRSVTTSLLAGHSLFKGLLNNLYLYIPLLTMGLMSREIGSGSIKLLFSSPITNVKIILGKYFAMALYCLLLVVLLIPIISFAGFTVKDIEFPLVLSALLGMYLLICSYAAIGLFMSCLTSYQVVAATGTLAVLAILNFIGGIGQEIAFVREITYWLSISGRVEELLEGLICSEDVLYFLIVIMLFVSLSILKLNSATKKPSFFLALAKYSVVVLFAVMLGYMSSRPTLMSYYDTTITKRNTLTPNSQEVVEKLDGGMTITTYCNLLDEDFYHGSPRSLNFDRERFKQYLRFKPEIKMKYVYYYDKVNDPSLYKRYPGMTEEEIVKSMCKVYGYDFDMFLSPQEIKKIIDLSPEGNRFVRVVKRENGQKIFLRLFDDSRKHPSETEVTAAFKRFIVKAPRVGFLVGHGERSIERTRDKDYSMFVNNVHFRSSLMNQGFDGVNLSLNNDIPDDIDIVVISDIRKAFSDDELEILDKYIARGGNLIISSDVDRKSIANPLFNKFGVSLEPGVLVQPQKDMKPNLIAANITKETKNISSRIFTTCRYGYKIAMEGAAGLSCVEDKGFEMTPLLVTNNKGSWSELETTNFMDDTVIMNNKAGEVEKSRPIALALSRKMDGKEQRVILLGDSDFISNGELSRNHMGIKAANFSFIPGMFEWLSYNQYPIDTSRPNSPDDAIFFKRSNASYVKTFFRFIFPGLILLLGAGLLYRRKRQ